MPRQRRQQQEPQKACEQEETGDYLLGLKRDREEQGYGQRGERGVGLPAQLLGRIQAVAGVEPERGPQPDPDAYVRHHGGERYLRERPAPPNNLNQARGLPDEKGEQDIRKNQGKDDQTLPAH